MTIPNNTLNLEINHRYLKPGIYNVSLTVVDDDGESDIDIVSIIVEKEQEKERTKFIVCGVVYKSHTSKRIAHVEISTSNNSLLTNYSGYYSIVIPKGTFIFKVSKDRYESISMTITIKSDTDLDFYLNPLTSEEDVGSTLDTTWDWYWILTFMLIVVAFFFIMLIKKRKKPTPQKIQSQEHDQFEPKISSIIKPKSSLSPIISAQKTNNIQQPEISPLTASKQLPPPDEKQDIFTNPTITPTPLESKSPPIAKPVVSKSINTPSTLIKNE